MQTWPVQDAKARFSEFLDACMAEGPQMVTKRGAEAASWCRSMNGDVCRPLPDRRSSNCCCRMKPAPIC